MLLLQDKAVGTTSHAVTNTVLFVASLVSACCSSKMIFYLMVEYLSPECVQVIISVLIYSL